MKRTCISLFFLCACLGFGLANAAADTPTAVSAGAYHTCVLTSAGGVECWGNNADGQLGDGTTTNRPTPVAVTGLSSGVAAISVGGFHTCALTSAGGVLCWGFNGDGELGDGTTTGRLTPVPAIGLSSGVVAIAAGTYHTCAVTLAGEVRCWGYGTYGQLGSGVPDLVTTPTPVFPPLTGVASLAAGGYHTCALTTAGAVDCWGLNEYGQTGNGFYLIISAPYSLPGLTSGVAAIAGGYEHTCALTSAGGMKCWGYNGSYQLGNATASPSVSPVEVRGLSAGVTAIAAGGLHTCAVVSPGVVKCWGNDQYGQLGDGITESNPFVRDVVGLSGGVTAVAAGYAHTCALTAVGGVRCWGDNEAGQLGDGTLTTRLTPVAAVGFEGIGPMAVAARAAGITATAATLHAMVDPDGIETTVRFEYGLTAAYGNTSADRAVAAGTSEVDVDVEATGLTCGALYHFRAVASNSVGTAYGADALFMTMPCVGAPGRATLVASGTHTCTLTSAGVLWCWGSNRYGVLGDGTTVDRYTPVAVAGLSGGVAAVAASGDYSCAVTTAGAALCWGYNNYGQLGDGTTTERHTPVPVNGLASAVVAISTGGGQTCALTSAGAVLCWGYNNYGQLGDGTTTNRSTPVSVSGLASGVVAIAAAGSHTCALTADGAVLCWGFNSSGQVGDATTTNRPTRVPVTGLSKGIAALDAGGSHTCVLTSAERVLCWGSNSSGQLGDGTTVNKSTPVELFSLSGPTVWVDAGPSQTCAVSSAGALQCWGSDSSGELGDGGFANKSTPVSVAGLPSGVVAAAAGGGYSCALTSAEQLRCWGNNSSGQLGDGTTTSRLTPVPVVRFGPALPTPVTKSVTALSTHSAKVVGTVSGWGVETSAWFEYGTTTGYGLATPAQAIGSVMDPVEISATVDGLPPHQPFHFRLVATNTTGTVSSPDFYFSGTPYPPPQPRAVTPFRGTNYGGNTVSITGTGFLAGAFVHFGYLLATNTTVVSDTLITVTVPGGQSGRVDVTVTNPDWQGAVLSKAYQYDLPVPFDLSGAGKSDLVVFRGSAGQWWIYGQPDPVTFGQEGDLPVVADYNGDDKAELAVYRPSTCEWIVQGHEPVVFGQTGDVPVPGDYNQDWKAEMAVFRPSTGEWIISGQDTPVVWGMRGDIPVPADYGGGGFTEIAVFRPTTGTWYVRGGQTLQWGMWGDIPVPADYNGDGKAELAIYRPSTGWWYPTGHNLVGAKWGSPGDVPVPIDVDADRTPEFVVFRPGDGTWYGLDPFYMQVTGFDATSATTWGQAGDTPVGQPPHLPVNSQKTAGDFDGDGAADVTLFRPSTGGWYTLKSTTAYRGSVSVVLGQAGDVQVPGHYQVAGSVERAVYRPSTGQWLLEDGRTFTLGAPDDVPVPGDYDGDGITDIAVFTPATAQWSALTGASDFTTLVTETWGSPGDVPAPGDYDGDGKTDLAVFTPATGQWSIRSSLTGATLVTVAFGMSGDIPVPGDYDGDGKTDIAVYRPGTGYWYVLTSSSNWSNYEWHWWGAVGDVPVPGDFDGDGVTDVAVYRPSAGTWYVMNVFTITGWGEAADVPVLGRR